MQHPQNPLCRAVLGTIAGGFVLAVAPAALAHAWPSKPIRLVFTGAPGGSADVVARTLADGLRPLLGRA